MTQSKPPTRIDFKKGKFTANGKEYFIVDYITVGRDVQYDMISTELSFNTDFQGFFKLITDIYKHATTGESPLSALHNISVKCMNVLDSIKTVGEEREQPYYKLCALFINTADEDPATITDAQIQEKIDDWKAEGIPREDFLMLAVTSIRGFRIAYEKLIQESEKAAKVTAKKIKTGNSPSKKKPSSQQGNESDQSRSK